MRLGITGSCDLYRHRGVARKANGDHAGAIADFHLALKCHMLRKDAVVVRLERGD